MSQNQENNTNKSQSALDPAFAKSSSAVREEAVLQFWKENNVFEKTLEKESSKGDFVFYDGPPTANGKPGIHHLEPRAFKDAIPRYKTMQGFHVRRKGGWDTHGLPVELQVEKALGLKSKKEIEQYGIEKFNAECRKSVWTYIDEWERFTDRMGYWIDHENPYRTYDNSYIQSLWNVVKKIDDQELLYKDYKVVPYCPRCGTALSSHELAQGYQDDTDLSVTAKFKIVGVENGYFLAWTTTPWTLPGNVGLAVGSEILYVEIKIGEQILVLAKDRLSIITEAYEVVAEHKGSEMVGMQYEPLYPYLAELDKGDEKLQNAYKVYAADFVTTTDGTGIVHTAVMYGQEDFELGTKVGLPKFHLVNPDGTFITGTGIFEGRFVKDEAVAVDVIKDLAHRGLLFKKEKYTHSYPHCWRCSTPLIYYARDSWYIGMSKLRDKLVAENEGINWEPSHVKEGRFGEWIREVKDWAISRERYWGTPLPIWVAEDGEKFVVDSFETLKKYTKKSGNKYVVMRHGESTHNVDWLCSSVADYPHHLTDSGKATVLETAQEFKSKNITVIYCSPFLRTKQTAEIVADAIGFDKSKIIYDDRVAEFKFGDFHLKPFSEYMAWRKETGDSLDLQAPNGESISDARHRFASFFYDIDQQHKNETVLVVTHGIGLETLPAVECGYDKKQMWEKWHMNLVAPGKFQDFNFIPLPHNESYELDVHRPFIDEIVLEKDGKQFARIKEVMDVWFDSGAMPFAQDGYPFLTDKVYYPADFIAEGLDQTRGWFYTLHAVGALMGTGKAYKNVICLGLILDKDGKKMSKSKGNVVDPWTMMDKYGADTLRLWMYAVNQPGDSKNFDEKTVAELHNKVFNLLYNVLAFYELYRDRELESDTDADPTTSTNPLDQWIFARLAELTETMTANLESYKLLEPVRAMREFIDDLSTWYVRRSRERLRDGSLVSKKTLYVVLKTVAKLLAPFAPFAAEDIWQKLKLESDTESVHLVQWPVAGKVDTGILTAMQTIREIVSLGLEARQKAGIKVKQPLSKLKVKNEELKSEYLELIKEELNVKEVILVASSESLEASVELDTEITPELKREGEYRELVRMVQDLRKEKGLLPSDVITLTLPEKYRETISGFGEEMKKTVGAKEITFTDVSEDIAIG
jgi:isoleucyl-tRNA synthetase